jgi:hypothetical protein
MKAEIWIKPKTILRTLLIINFSLALFSLLLCSLENIFSDKFILLHIIAKLFSTDGERNIPAFYSSVILVISSILFAIIAVLKYQLKNYFVNHWVVLAIFFSLMAWDEAVSIHERLMDNAFYKFFLHEIGIEAYGILTFSWVVLGSIFVVFL